MSEGDNLNTYGGDVISDDSRSKEWWNNEGNKILDNIAGEDNTSELSEKPSLDQAVEEFDKSVEDEGNSLELPASEELTDIPSIDHDDRKESRETEDSSFSENAEKSKEIETNLSKDTNPEFYKFDTLKYVVEVKRLQEESDRKFDREIEKANADHQMKLNQIDEQRKKKNSLFEAAKQAAKSFEETLSQLNKQ